MIDDDETNCAHKLLLLLLLLLTNRQVANLCRAFANKSSTDIKQIKNSNI